MHYHKCFLEVMELDILDCMYMYMVFWLGKEQQEPIYILPRVSKSEKRKRSGGIR